MHFDPPLSTGILHKRYKRFLADITLDSGESITAHCPNTGSMLSCSTLGSRVGVSRSANPQRKYPYTLEIVEDNGSWVGVNTARSNAIVAEGISQGIISSFGKVISLQREVKVSAKSRLDILLDHGKSTTFVEVKNCSLAKDRVAMFPDAVTKRGTKHLYELMELVAKGEQACIFFLVQRQDADSFTPAMTIDPEYSTALKQAAQQGVQVVAWQAKVSPQGITIHRELAVHL
ncbi:DNA/RNA nuclease SfsA [candidate division KSB3 bacterium]|uniref:Sugar fermentation stimulation protein homolog n=1 Tax=candidate division KSB3 bacterium TaxID=2044937 RepID=A0A2G6EBL3_9BACT|nr:MAG: DNA/RNA nuclease SfsA [candidate division KSB3 bacterium]